MFKNNIYFINIFAPSHASVLLNILNKHIKYICNYEKIGKANHRQYSRKQAYPCTVELSLLLLLRFII